jgi:hypothetical protein
MPKPRKTAAELQKLIYAETNKSSVCPPEMTITILSKGHSWDARANCKQETAPLGCVSLVGDIAARLRVRYDLKR